MIESEMCTVLDSYRKCCKCKELLNLEPGNPQRLDYLEEDIANLRELWQEMRKVWAFIEDIKEQPVLTAP